MSTTKNTTNTTKNTTEKGMLVKALVHGGGVRDMIVWDVEDETYYLCTSKCYENLSKGDFSTRPIGYPSKALIFE